MKEWWLNRPKWQQVVMLVVGVVVVAGVAGSGEGSAPTTTAPPSQAAGTTSDATTTSTSPPSERPPTSATQAPETAPSSTTTSTTTITTSPQPEVAFSDGTWIVGDEIAPGLYETIDDAGSNCYWERLSGLGGTFEEIIANNISAGHDIVEIFASDVAFSSSGCGGWIELTPREPLLTDIPAGKWAVGVHIAPGRYRSVGGGQDCYWERLSGFSGTFGDIIANDLGGGAIVDISASDTGFNSSGCGSWQLMG